MLHYAVLGNIRLWSNALCMLLSHYNTLHCYTVLKCIVLHVRSFLVTILCRILSYHIIPYYIIHIFNFNKQCNIIRHATEICYTILYYIAEYHAYAHLHIYIYIYTVIYVHVHVYAYARVDVDVAGLTRKHLSRPCFEVDARE